MGYLYRPNEIVVRVDPDRHDLSDRIDKVNGKPARRRLVPAMNAEIYDLGAEERIADVLGDLRGEGVPVARHLVMRGEPWYAGGPGGPPAPADIGDVRRPCDRGKGVMIAVLDTGLETHQFFAAGDVQGVRPPFADVADADGDKKIDFQAGHGTFVSGVILADAPGASIRVLGTLNSHGFVSEEDLCNDLELAGSKLGVQIVNLSLGGYSENGDEPVGLAHAIDELRARGILVVAAAGNDNRSDPFYPAAFDRENVLSVGAVVGESPDFVRADYSNHGDWVHLGAAGTIQGPFLTYNQEREGNGMDTHKSIPAQNFTGWATWAGTSFATPQVTAAAAVLLSAGVARNAIDAADMLRRMPASPGMKRPVVTLDAVDGLLP